MTAASTGWPGARRTSRAAAGSAQRLRDSGLEVRVDEALNVFGHRPGARGPFLLTGSHLDSVPSGGRLDGAYGAVAALEVLRTLHESDDPIAAQVEVVRFCR